MQVHPAQHIRQGLSPLLFCVWGGIVPFRGKLGTICEAVPYGWPQSSDDSLGSARHFRRSSRHKKYKTVNYLSDTSNIVRQNKGG